jgi:hypothetical protein
MGLPKILLFDRITPHVGGRVADFSRTPRGFRTICVITVIKAGGRRAADAAAAIAVEMMLAGARPPTLDQITRTKTMTQGSQYDFPAVDPHWADTRGTHPAVAAAIHAIAGAQRTPQAIWEAPTDAEFELYGWRSANTSAPVWSFRKMTAATNGASKRSSVSVNPPSANASVP